MPTIGWKLRQIEGWKRLSHGSKGPPSQWNAHMCNHNHNQGVIRDVQAKGGDKWQQSQASRPSTCAPHVPLRMTVTSNIILASKPSNRPSTILKAYKYMPPPLFQDMENWSKSKVKCSAAHISIENRERGEVRVRRRAGVSAHLQLCTSEEWSFCSSNFLLFHR
jgi:hypothetical protein